MADKVLKVLESKLNCPICLDTYTNPKQLQCHHVFCQECLANMVNQGLWGQLTLTCPNCRQVTPVPASGVRGLQAAFQVNQFLEVVEESKKAAVSADDYAIGCPEHDGRVEELYCETCGEIICYKCIMKGEKHQTHDYKELVEAFEQYQEELKLSLEPMENQLIAIDKALPEFDACHDEIAEQQVAVEADIHKTITQLQETLDVRKDELISQLDSITRAKFTSLSVKRDWLETIQAQLRSCVRLMRENLKTSNQGKAMKMKSITTKQAKELTTSFQPEMMEPSIESDMMFSTLANLNVECMNYGKVHVIGPPDLSKSSITGKRLDTATVGETSTVILQLVNSDNLPCKLSVAFISCELVSDILTTRARCGVKKTQQGQYEISYNPTIKGRHQLHIKVSGDHIRDSPFPVCVMLPVEKIDAPIPTRKLIDGLKLPNRVAINQKCEVVVIEQWGQRVTAISPSGENRRSFGTNGSGQGQFDWPQGVAVDREDNIFVADTFNDRIQKFTAQGVFIKEKYIKGALSQPSRPSDILFNASNDRLYVLTAIGTVQILNSDLSYHSAFGKTGKGKGQLYFPSCLACDCTGNIYVSDTYNHRIQVFTAEGKLLRMIEDHDKNEGT